MRLTTGVLGDGDVVGTTLRAAAGGVVGSERHAKIKVHVVPKEWWWAGTLETLCSRTVATVVGWHNPDEPDPRLCTVCARRVAQLTTDRLLTA